MPHLPNHKPNRRKPPYKIPAQRVTEKNIDILDRYQNASGNTTWYEEVWEYPGEDIIEVDTEAEDEDEYEYELLNSGDETGNTRRTPLKKEDIDRKMLKCTQRMFTPSAGSSLAAPEDPNSARLLSTTLHADPHTFILTFRLHLNPSRDYTYTAEPASSIFTNASDDSWVFRVSELGSGIWGGVGGERLVVCEEVFKVPGCYVVEEVRDEENLVDEVEGVVEWEVVFPGREGVEGRG